MYGSSNFKIIGVGGVGVVCVCGGGGGIGCVCVWGGIIGRTETNKRQESVKKKNSSPYWTIDVSFDIRPNELLYKESSCQWIETAYVAHVTSL